MVIYWLLILVDYFYFVLDVFETFKNREFVQLQPCCSDICVQKATTDHANTNTEKDSTQLIMCNNLF